MARLLLLTTDADARDPNAPIRSLGEVLNELCDELDTGRRRAPGPGPEDVTAIAGFLGLTPRQTAILQGWLKQHEPGRAKEGGRAAHDGGRPAGLSLVGAARARGGVR